MVKFTRYKDIGSVSALLEQFSDAVKVVFVNYSNRIEIIGKIITGEIRYIPLWEWLLEM